MLLQNIDSYKVTKLDVIDYAKLALISSKRWLKPEVQHLHTESDFFMYVIITHHECLWKNRMIVECVIENYTIQITLKSTASVVA